jgi:hypothetical protein
MATLQDVEATLRSEYALRRRMLVERVKVTLQSFLWSNRWVGGWVGGEGEVHSPVFPLD